MKTNSLIKVLFIGNLIINIPFLLTFIYLFSLENYFDKMTILFIAFFVGWIYWSYASVWYRKFSQKYIKTKEDYFTWKKFSVYFLLLWPDNFLFTKTEYWDDKDFHNYNIWKSNLLKG